MLTGVEAVIVDEIHAVAGDEARLAPRADARAARRELSEHEPQRIGLSRDAEPARGGRALPRRPAAHGADRRRRRAQAARPEDPGAGRVDGRARAATRRARPARARRRRRGDARARSGRRSTRSCSSWSSEHRSTIVFVNNRRGAERLALRLNELADERRRGSARHRPLPPRLAGARGAPRRRGAAQGRRAAVPRRHVVARARHRHGRRRPRAAGRVAEVRLARAAAHRPRRPRRRRHVEGPDLPEVPRRPARVRGRHAAHARGAGSSRRSCRATRSTCSPSRSSRSPPPPSRSRWRVDELYALVTRTHSYARAAARRCSRTCSTCSTAATRQREFGELRPRIVWDRVGGTIRARKGARQLAVTNAGHDPRPRPLHRSRCPTAAASASSTRRWSTRRGPGQTFLLGASTWRIEEIGRDRVIVTPAPGAPGRRAVLEGRRRRPAEGARRARSARSAAGRSTSPPRCSSATTTSTRSPRSNLARLPARAAGRHARRARATARSSSSASATRSATGALCVLSPYGGRVHAAWALALSARIRDELGLESDAIWSDDGIIVHLPDADEPPGADLVLHRPRRARGPGRRRARRAARCSARASARTRRASLLIPRAYPGKRTPLWQQRLKSQTLLEVAKRYARLPDHPRDLPRVPARRARPARACRSCCAQLHRRELSLVEVETPTASPFASSLLFDYVATYMYEGDTPNAERRAAALSLDRDLLRELLGQEELRDLIDPDALEQVEADLQHRSDRTRAETRDALHDVLRRVGDLTRRRGRASACSPGSTPRRCCSRARRRAPRGAAARRAARSAGSPPTTPASTATRSAPCRRAGCPRRSSPTCPTRSRSSSRRYARTHGPFTTAELRDALRRRPERARCAALERAGELVRGELRPGGTEREWCDPEVLRRLRRASLAVLRKEVEAVDQRALAAFLPSWQGVDRHPAARRRASTACARRSSRSRASRCPPTCGSATCCRAASAPTRRRGSTSSAPPARSCGSARARSAATRGRVALYFREDAPLLGPPARAAASSAPARARARRSARAPARSRRASSPTCSPSSTSRPRSCRRRCGTSCGPAR